MRICVIMEKSDFALYINLSFKVHFQAYELLNVLLWFIHEPYMALWQSNLKFIWRS